MKNMEKGFHLCDVYVFMSGGVSLNHYTNKKNLLLIFFIYHTNNFLSKPFNSNSITQHAILN